MGLEVLILQKSLFSDTLEFNDSKILIIKKTSDNLGIFFNFFSLSVNNEAANIGRQEFFDPLILILPSSFFWPLI